MSDNGYTLYMGGRLCQTRAGEGGELSLVFCAGYRGIKYASDIIHGTEIGLCSYSGLEEQARTNGIGRILFIPPDGPTPQEMPEFREVATNR